MSAAPTVASSPQCFRNRIHAGHRHLHTQHTQQKQHQQRRHSTALSAAASAVSPEAAMPVLFTTLLLAAALPVVKALLMSCVGAYAAMKVRSQSKEGRQESRLPCPCVFWSGSSKVVTSISMASAPEGTSMKVDRVSSMSLEAGISPLNLLNTRTQQVSTGWAGTFCLTTETVLRCYSTVTGRLRWNVGLRPTSASKTQYGR